MLHIANLRSSLLGLLVVPNFLPSHTPRFIQDDKHGVVLTVHVQPKAAHTACVGTYGEALKIRIAAPPVEGAANRELVRFLAEALSLPRGAVHIESGEGSRHKRVRLEGTTAAEVMRCLIQMGSARA